LKFLGNSPVIHRNNRHASDLRRRRRRLQEKGKVTVECIREAIFEKLEEAFALERQGWKGERGTAMSQMESTQGFYRDIARWAEKEHALAIYFLRVDNRLVAFDFGIQYRQRFYSLKVGYDESFSTCSPGMLLTEDTLQDVVKQGVVEFDFLGDDSPGKRDWTQELRPHHWLYIFRNSTKGRMLHRAKFHLTPAAKKIFGKSDVTS
jgi:CelD/BcsL family acetyltransferase involved in cellulose biosynthesis